ncbi:MAG TPA: aldo/keto reductase family protein [Ignavibacteria bacterium]|nr:aldo/keto reductase family protein [Ignavibacteria bacterium]
MKYRKLGKCGTKVSVIGIGSWLTLGGSVEKKSGDKIIRLAFDNGINFFDTADVYAKGEAEKFLGNSLRNFKRQDLVIATKCFGAMSQNSNDKGLSRKHIFESVNNSLTNLKTDYIDIYQCHRYDTDTPLEETCRAFNTLIELGKILYWGVSEWSRKEIENAVNFCDLNGLHKPVSNQPQYSLLSRDIETNGVLNYCSKEGIGLVVWSPLAQGVLTGKYNKKKIDKDSRLMDKNNNMFVKKLASEENLKKVGKLIKLAEELKTTPSNVALAWCLRNEIVSSVITSSTKESQLKENIKASELQLSGNILKQTEQIFKIIK